MHIWVINECEGSCTVRHYLFSWPPEYVRVGETGDDTKGNDTFFFLDVKN